MKIAIWIGMLLMVASATTVAAQDGGRPIAASSDRAMARVDEGKNASGPGRAMATPPIHKTPACFDAHGFEDYHPAPADILESGARPGPITCSYGDTPNSRILSDEQASLCSVTGEALQGAKAQARDTRTRAAVAGSHPTSLDWRRKDGQDWTTPVRDTSTCGSCVAFAVIGSIESRLKIAAGDSSLDPDLSEAHLFFGSCDRCCDGGMTLEPAMIFARDNGITDEACYPYSPQNQPNSPCTGWQSRTTAIAGWTGTFSTDVMKRVLAESGPIVASLALDDDFRSYSGGIYQHTKGRFSGRHAVILVGYDDSEGYWIGKNSWGTKWGEDRDGNPNGGGWFRIYYGQAGIDDFAYIPKLSVDNAGNDSMGLASAQETGFVTR